MKMPSVMCEKADCFQNLCGISCRLLETPIKDHKCPFYKTDAQVAEERRAVIDRLESIDRYDLIDAYIYNSKRNW